MKTLHKRSILAVARCSRSAPRPRKTTPQSATQVQKGLPASIAGGVWSGGESFEDRLDTQQDGMIAREEAMARADDSRMRGAKLDPKIAAR
jgi:hypothetical protein